MSASVELVDGRIYLRVGADRYELSRDNAVSLRADLLRALVEAQMVSA